MREHLRSSLNVSSLSHERCFVGHACVHLQDHVDTLAQTGVQGDLGGVDLRPYTAFREQKSRQFMSLERDEEQGIDNAKDAK